MPKDRRTRTQRFERARVECEKAVMALSGVSGVALGEDEGEPRIIVYVERLTPELRRRIASEYGGVRVKIEESGTFHAQ